MLWAALSYLVIGTVALWPSIGPGRTLVAADGVSIVTPFSALPAPDAPDNLQLSDVTFQFYPWFAFIADGLRHGEVRQWNPTLLGGVPVTPNGNVSPYYPPTWLGAVLAPLDAYNLFVLLHLVIGALGLYVLARALGVPPWPSWVAGLLGFSAATWVHWSTHLVHLAGMVWTPWVLAATWFLIAAPSRRRAAALAAVTGLWLLGGSPQYVYYGALALLGWAAAALVGRWTASAPVFRAGLAFGGAMALGALLAAPILLPTAAVAGKVAREREPGPPIGHVPKREAIRALVPDATGNPADSVFFGSNDELRMDSPFVGVTTFVLAGAGLAGLTRRGRRRGDGAGRLVLALGMGAVIVLAFTGFPHRVLYASIPGYDRFRASPRWLFLLPAFAVPLAALGFQDLLAGARRARQAVVVTAGLAVLAIGAWYAIEHSKTGFPTSYLSHRALLAAGFAISVAAAGWLARRRPRLATVLLTACALAEIAFHTPRWYPSVQERTAYPEVAVADIAAARGGRFVHVGGRTTFPPFAPDLSTAYGLADVGGLSVLFPKDYDRFLRLIDDYGRYAQDFNAAPPLASGDLLASPLLDVLDVRTVVGERDVPIPGRYGLLVPPTAEPWVYERQSPGGAIVVTTASPATEAEMWSRVGDAGWDPARTAAVAGLDGVVTGTGATVHEGPTTSDTERWDVDAPGGGFLRVGARWDTGWSATVDGRATPVLRADAIFRGVVVPPGRHEVRFSYRNPAEMRGRRATGLALVVLIALVIPWPVRMRARVNREAM